MYEIKHRRTGMQRDSQRQALYDLETRLFGWGEGMQKLSILECQALVKDVFRGFAVAPSVKYSGRSRRALYKPTTHQIELPEWTRVRFIVLHEAAHALTYARLRGTPHAWHGPEFVRVYFELLVAYGVASPEVLKTELTRGKRRVRIAETGELPWRKRRGSNIGWNLDPKSRDIRERGQ